MDIHTVRQTIRFQSKSKSWLICIMVPLILSTFIHLWNPLGFPAIEQDEGHYMRRTMQVLEGLGPQESTSTFFYAYDHPYFGQVFLAAILSLINYPDFLNPSVSAQSIEMLFLVPRVLMGIFAVFDTFLVYKIADIRYGRKAAFVSSILFAVMPLSWFTRRVYLDSIELPFILLSILFAVYYAKKSEYYSDRNIGYDKNIILILLSGIFLGLAIFTKAPVFTMIPLIAYIILKSNKKDRETRTTNGKTPNITSKLTFLGIWFIPVILIPMMWPGYALSVGQLGEWADGVLWQATRADRPFGEEIKNAFFRLDPIVLGLGAMGLIYAIIKKEYFLLIWAFPYLTFIYFVNWVYFFHLIPVFAVFCITITIMISELVTKTKYKSLKKPLEFIVFSTIIIFGFINTTLLITQELNNPSFVLASIVTQLLPNKSTGGHEPSEMVALIAPNGAFSIYWIPSLVFNKDINFKWFEARRDYIGDPVDNEKIYMIVDKDMRYLFTINSTKKHIEYVTRLYNNSTLLNTLSYNGSLPNLQAYPYTNILDDAFKGDINRRGIDWSEKIEIKKVN